jgi:hypothetical protein
MARDSHGDEKVSVPPANGALYHLIGEVDRKTALKGSAACEKADPLLTFIGLWSYGRFDEEPQNGSRMEESILLDNGPPDNAPREGGLRILQGC